MRGFIVGSLLLIALETLLQPHNANQVAGAGGLAIRGLNRLLSPGVAGIPNRASSTPAKASPAPAPANPPSAASGTPASAPLVGQTLTTKYV